MIYPSQCQGNHSCSGNKFNIFNTMSDQRELLYKIISIEMLHYIRDLRESMCGDISGLSGAELNANYSRSNSNKENKNAIEQDGRAWLDTADLTWIPGLHR